MVITDFLERNARLYGSDIALVELNPSAERDSAATWREAQLIEAANPGAPYRRELNWADFDRRANRFANLLLSRGRRSRQAQRIRCSSRLCNEQRYFGNERTELWRRHAGQSGQDYEDRHLHQLLHLLCGIHAGSTLPRDFAQTLCQRSRAYRGRYRLHQVLQL